MKIPNIDKKYIWIGVGILVLGCIGALILWWVVTVGGKKQVAALVIPQTIPQTTPTAFLPTPTVTPLPVVPGNIWIVASIEQNAIREGLFLYDVATFYNKNVPTIIMKAQCGAPGWPSPEIGQQYVLSEYNVLVPIEGIESPLQRFYPLK